MFYELYWYLSTQNNKNKLKMAIWVLSKAKNISLSNLSLIRGNIRKKSGGALLYVCYSKLIRSIFGCQSHLPLSPFGIHQLMQAPNLDR